VKRLAITSATVATVAAAAAVAATAHATPVPLPTVLTQLTPGPPFGAPLVTGENEGGALRFPVASDERIDVGIDARGVPVSIHVRQRLDLLRAGDYSFIIGAPVEDVRAAPGSESEPGLREGAILWQGFSPRRKLLAADLVLRAPAARSVLPLRIVVDHRRATWRIRLVNATATPYQTFTGNARAADAAAALDEVRRRGGVPTTRPIAVELRGKADAAHGIVAAPLHVTGEIRFRRGALAHARVEGGSEQGDVISVDVVLGDATPLTHDVVVDGVGNAVPQLRLVVTPRPPERALTPPTGATWSAYVRRAKNVDTRALVSRAVRAALAWARARQYDAFVSNPDPYGRRSAVYRYATAARAAEAVPPRPPEGDGFPVALVAIPLAVVAAGALVVLWAHS